MTQNPLSWRLTADAPHTIDHSVTAKPTFREPASPIELPGVGGSNQRLTDLIFACARLLVSANDCYEKEERRDRLRSESKTRTKASTEPHR